jgi:hypothetical protein
MGSNGDRGQMVMSYLTLRRTVGVLGVLLPVILPLGVLVLGSSAAFQDSISAYHGTVMRGVFVGVLSAIGVFLFSYVGYPPSDDKKPYDLSDNWAGNLAGASAIGVALFPATSDDGLVTAIHFVAAAILFLTLAYFSLHLFRKTGDSPSSEKLTRNKLYLVSGVTILVCVALVPLYNLLPEGNEIASIKPVFWLESLALWAFGFAWFVKGDGLRRLNDPE